VYEPLLLGNLLNHSLTIVYSWWKTRHYLTIFFNRERRRRRPGRAGRNGFFSF